MKMKDMWVVGILSNIRGDAPTVNFKHCQICGARFPNFTAAYCPINRRITSITWRTFLDIVRPSCLSFTWIQFI